MILPPGDGMRIELINLPFSSDIRRRLDPPLYLLQLAPVLIEEGFHVRVNDLNGIDPYSWTFGHCLFYLLYVDARSFETAKKVALMCREVNPRGIVIVCGSGPSKEVVKYVKTPEFDAIIKGEAERALLNFIEDSIQLVSDRDRNKIYSSEVGNVNRLPLPARHLVELNTYTRRLDGYKATMVMGSRGSPFRSTWLCRGLKTFSVSRIMNEIDDIVKKYGIRGFLFGDECFTYDRIRAIDIGKGLAERKLIFGFNDDVQRVNIQLYKTLYELGAREVLLNFYTKRDTAFGKSMQSKIEAETNMRVTLKQEAKYRRQA